MSGSASFHALGIADIRPETADAVSIAFDVPAELRPAFAFRPGQYLTLRATLGGEEVRRSYSICSARDDGELRIAVKHVPDGVFSRHANTELRPGATLEVMPPAGRFGHDVAGGTIVAIAAGSGITPILSIVSTESCPLAGRTRAAVLRQPRDRRDPVSRGARGPQGPPSRASVGLPRPVPRGTGSVALNGRLDAAKLRAMLPRAIDPTRSTTRWSAARPG